MTMTGRRAIVGLCTLCALAFSVVAVQGAAAASNGTTAVTCLKVMPKSPTAGFSDSKCRNGVEFNANFEHLGFASGTKSTSRGALTKLHSVISGVEVELQSTELTGSGEVENMQAAGGEHTIFLMGVLSYKSATVTKPAGKGCVVTGGEVVTKELKATTAGQGMGLKFEPASGTLFAEFNITGCSIAALNGKYEVKGSVIATPEGTEDVTTAAGTTAQGTLKLRGQNAGIDGAVETLGESGTPLAKTTFFTP